MSGSRMSKDLAISRTAVWSHIEELRQLGYGIEADPHQGTVFFMSPTSCSGMIS